MKTALKVGWYLNTMYSLQSAPTPLIQELNAQHCSDECFNYCFGRNIMILNNDMIWGLKKVLSSSLGQVGFLAGPYKSSSNKMEMSKK